MNVFSIVSIILGSSYSYNAEEVATAISNIFRIKNMRKKALDVRVGSITEFRIQPEIKIGESYQVSATYEGSVKGGYLNLLIVDRDGVKQWFADENSIDQKLLDSGKRVQAGKLNFSNGVYESKWEFTPRRPLYAGYAKAIVHMFEDSNVYPLALLEKDINLI